MNIYENNLKQAKEKMQQCQEQTQGKLSCLNCSNLCECEIREKFVKATYETMSQGKSQEFNF